MNSLPERTNRIAAFLAMEAEPSVAKLREISFPDFFACKYPGQHEVEDCYLVVHAASRDAENGNYIRARSAGFSGQTSFIVIICREFYLLSAFCLPPSEDTLRGTLRRGAPRNHR